MPHFAEHARAVQLGGLIQTAVHAGNGGQINDGVPADGLPHAGDHVDRSEILRRAEEINRLSAEQHDDCIEKAAIRAQKAADDARDNDDGKEVRKIGNRLHELLKVLVLQFVDQQRQQNRRRERPQKRIKAQKEGVSHQPPEIVGRHEAPEPVKAEPFAGEDAAYAEERLIVLEGNDDAENRQVLEQDEIRHARQQKQIQQPVPLQIEQRPLADAERRSFVESGACQFVHLTPWIKMRSGGEAGSPPAVSGQAVNQPSNASH